MTSNIERYLSKLPRSIKIIDIDFKNVISLPSLLSFENL